MVLRVEDEADLLVEERDVLSVGAFRDGQPVDLAEDGQVLEVLPDVVGEPLTAQLAFGDAPDERVPEDSFEDGAAFPRNSPVKLVDLSMTDNCGLLSAPGLGGGQIKRKRPVPKVPRRCFQEI